MWTGLILPTKTLRCTEHKSDLSEGLSVASQWKTWYPRTSQIHANPLRLIWVRFLPVSEHCYGCQVKLGRADCLAINTFKMTAVPDTPSHMNTSRLEQNQPILNKELHIERLTHRHCMTMIHKQHGSISFRATTKAQLLIDTKPPASKC